MIKKFTLHPFLVSFFLKKKKKMFFLKVAIFINLFNKNELVLYSSNFKETFDFDIKKKEGYKILKIFKIGKKIFFYNAFPIVSYKPISKKTKPIDCFYEVKFAIKIKKKKGKWLIGKLNRKKNLINIFPIAKTLDKVFPNNLKKKFLKFSPFCSNFPNFFDNKKNNWNSSKKDFFTKTKKNFFFFSNFYKISMGLKDYFLNLDLSFKKKPVFFKKFKPRKKFKRLIFRPKKKLFTLKNFLSLLYRSINGKINFCCFNFIKKKKIFSKGINLVCFGLGFFLNNFFLISSSIAFKKFNLFTPQNILFDFFCQLLFENDFQKKQFFPFFIASIIKSYLNEQIQKKSKKNLRNLILKKTYKKKYFEKITFLKKNQNIWNKKQSLSEIQSNLFLKKFFNKLKKSFVPPQFSFFFFYCIQSLLLTISFDTGFFLGKKNLNFFWKDNEIIIQNKTPFYSYKNWENFDLDFNFLKFKKMHF